MGLQELLQTIGRLQREFDMSEGKLVELKRQSESLIQQLKEEWNVLTVEEAEIMLESKKVALFELGEEIQQELNSIEGEL